MKKITSFWLVLSSLIIVITCSSWGFLIHRTVNQLAIYELPKGMLPFFDKNMAYIVKNAPRPDNRRNDDTTEAPKHFIDLEMYGTNAATDMPKLWSDAVAKYSIDTLHTYGYVPYHIIVMKERLTDAFKKMDKDSILFYATDLGHYIGDANVPLHTATNYDGQLSNQKGIHSLWESMVPELEITHYDLASKHSATYLKDPSEEIWVAIRRSHALVDDMMAKEIEVTKNFTPEQKYRTQMRKGKEVKSYTSEFAKAYATSLGTTINEQLKHSADMIADFWYTAWVDAGKPDLQVSFTKEEKKAFKQEKKYFKKNELIAHDLLISKKEKKEDK